MSTGAMENLQMMQFQKEKQNRYMTVKQWVSTFGYIPEGGLRHLIFSNQEFNKQVVKRLGRKVLLDVEALERYIADANQPQ